MDKDEARQLLTDKLAEYRAQTYDNLVARIGEIDALQVTGSSGAEYQIEVQFCWDREPNGDLRVQAAIDDGSFRHAFLPMCDDFIIAPNGRMIGK